MIMFCGSYKQPNYNKYNSGLCIFGNNEALINIIDCSGIRIKATLVIRKLPFKLISILVATMTGAYRGGVSEVSGNPL